MEPDEFPWPVGRTSGTVTVTDVLVPMGRTSGTVTVTGVSPFINWRLMGLFFRFFSLFFFDFSVFLDELTLCLLNSLVPGNLEVAMSCLLGSKYVG